MDFKIVGELVILRPIVCTDIADYERWNNPDSRANLTDRLWYNEDLSGLIEGRKKDSRTVMGRRIAPWK